MVLNSPVHRGKTRFLGIFDTVAAIGTPVNGFNPHSADTGDVNLALRPV